jgi:hypothetical protein
MLTGIATPLVKLAVNQAVAATKIVVEIPQVVLLLLIAKANVEAINGSTVVTYAMEMAPHVVESLVHFTIALEFAEALLFMTAVGFAVELVLFVHRALIHWTIALQIV